MPDIRCVILAAGDGKRMKSKKPKVMCPILFKPMIQWVYDYVKQSGISHVSVVYGQGGEHIMRALGDEPVYIHQPERKGTGHAAACAESFWETGEHVLVLCGDAPFVSDDTIRESLSRHLSSEADITVITARIPNPTGYGRIIRNGDEVSAIVEQKELLPGQEQIDEVNSAAYWFRVSALKDALPLVSADNNQNEYYLTDTVRLCAERGGRCIAYEAHPDAILGANSREALMELNELARMRIIRKHLACGVHIVSSDGVLIGPDVTIGADTEILPGTIISGHTEIGEDCVIGPNSRLEDCTVGDGCIINASQLEESTVGNGVRIGPFSHLRPHSALADGVKVGNFVEIKNSHVGANTSVAHLTYIGDSNFGERINVGCGVITSNYDGKHKHRTKVEDGVFIGCNVNLIAPVTVKSGAYIAAGSTINKDVPENVLAIARARQEIKEGWKKN